MPPNVLILSFCRYVFDSKNNRTSKDTSVVEFPIENMDVNDLYGHNCTYDLYALVCHRGATTHVGHYTGIK